MEPNNSPLDKSIMRSNKAMNMAFDRSIKRSGLNADPDLRLYNNLIQDDFKTLTQIYGEADVLQYIKAMEKKRLLGG